jgi:hypothetical protein
MRTLLIIPAHLLHIKLCFMTKYVPGGSINPRVYTANVF